MSWYIEIRTVTIDEVDQRLDRWFSKHFPTIPHGKISKLLRTGQIRVDGRRAKVNYRLMLGQTIRIPSLFNGVIYESHSTKPFQQDVMTGDKLVKSVLYRDEEIIAINKPAGLAVQGGSGLTKHVDGALDMLRFEANERPRLVHRLDKYTSGVLILARQRSAARRLINVFRAKSAIKIYLALVMGEPQPTFGRINLPIAKVLNKVREKMMIVQENGKSAFTRYVTLEKLSCHVTLVALFPVTGRTHQLRVHMAAIGTPILGDRKYGGAKAFLRNDLVSKNIHLHAWAIRIPSYGGGKLEVTAPLRDHMMRSLHFFGVKPERYKLPFSFFGC
ncbi:pseudouridine synthase [Candidatus Endolissoclinum faulkneri L5]|uniref:Pseudouridine synthase n=1 Tax=Candidatus Endolissoclinum faulkneri L5 TaxID=1401328 RepID=V9TQX4_9PROT|nr:RluA family pseudouridine synthase [Candidatus Endolissoclinum faulkneri]AHC73279.1 pseudouridine synthase [Candidatus Endolissoclinum faulkneri L5]